MRDDQTTPGKSTASPFARVGGNPILTVDQWPYHAGAVFNPAAARLDGGETILLCRVEETTGLSHLCLATSANGLTDWKIDSQPTFSPACEKFPEEAWGIEDPRIVYLPELEKYAVIYTCYGPNGPGVSLALTTDFREFERLGNVLPPEDKDAALLPERVDGQWLMIHRPVPEPGRKHIWISASPDLVHWGKRRLLLKARRGGWWDANKIGLGTPLIRTPQGFLMIYHGVRDTVGGSIYRVGLALLDQKDPGKCLVRSRNWLMGPRHPLERVGDVGNVVFPCGYTSDGSRIRLYYGMADSCIGMAEAEIGDLLDWLDRHASDPESGTG